MSILLSGPWTLAPGPLSFYSTFTPTAISCCRSERILSRSSAAVSKSSAFAAARNLLVEPADELRMFTVGTYSPASSAAIGTVK